MKGALFIFTLLNHFPCKNSIKRRIKFCYVKSSCMMALMVTNLFRLTDALDWRENQKKGTRIPSDTIPL